MTPANEPRWAVEPDTEHSVLSLERTLALLQNGTVEVHRLLPYSSNYTFLAIIHDDPSERAATPVEHANATEGSSGRDLRALVVYKPRKGERPLWDFPRGTLCQREVAAYLISEALGWHLVPPTVLRDGPHGWGMVQLYIDHDPDEHYFTFRDEAAPILPTIALFDIVINNADRKGGHCLRDRAGCIWCIDHGITFHQDPKLRTVIWDFVGQAIPESLTADLRSLQAQLAPRKPLAEALSRLLSAEECEALLKRIRYLIRSGHFPSPSSGRHVPWPMV
ncbi:MAG TPA: hypothetical protein DEP84_12650 [Chloroflexi bacterium]|nr:hypothetical protein [Chloroflexota bacterium]